MSIPRSEVLSILRCLDAGIAIPSDLLIWLPLAEAEGLIHYTTTPDDALPSSYPLFGPPTDIHLELTPAGRDALAQAELAARREGGER